MFTRSPFLVTSSSRDNLNDNEFFNMNADDFFKLLSALDFSLSGVPIVLPFDREKSNLKFITCFENSSVFLSEA